MNTSKSDWLRFGLLGVVVFALPLGLRTLVLVRSVDQPAASRAWPAWIHAVEYGEAAIPWVIGAALLVLAITRKRWIPLVAFATAQLLGLAVVLTVLLAGPVVADYGSRTAFDSARWKIENLADAKGVRVRMVDDLLHKHRLKGMTREQIDELLGVPPHTNYFHEYDYVYWLGPERGFISIDSEWLVVKFENGVVKDARVLRD
jgi:outer membrane protein assembly factor BamE (lipoprotein component of BamABCDE complex)